jgi:ferric-dicitrate binding protein FerR (iron transport regulator)
MTTKEYIDKWLMGTLSESERIAFEKTKDFKELQKLDYHLKQFKAPDYAPQEEYINLKQKLPREAKVISINWLQPFLKVAAAVLVVIVGYGLYAMLLTENIRTQMANQSSFLLPDSSSVLLNAQSEITYGTYNWQENRELELAGEAFFKVAKGSQFDINTTLGTVTVLGTQFNVIARGEYFEVVCFEGKVQVAHEGGTENLTAGSMFRVLNGETLTADVKLAGKPSWTLNESSFSSLPYTYIIDELERQYDVVVETQSVDTAVLFTGSFVHSDLELALQALTRPLNLTYSIKGKEIILTGED